MHQKYIVPVHMQAQKAVALEVDRGDGESLRC